MSELKCPFCGRELSEYDHFDRLLVCFNPQCEAVFTKKDFLGNKNLWQELIRTRKALDVAVDALKKYTDASGNWWYGYEFQGKYKDYAGEYADKAIEEITALEQEDVK